MQECRHGGMKVWRHTAAFPQSAVPVQKRGVAAIKERIRKGFTYTVKHFNISMLMEKEPVYLAFSTQKGGAGKTTLTVLVGAVPARA